MLGKLIAGIIGGVLVAAFGIPLAGILASYAGVHLDRFVPLLFPLVVIAAIVSAIFAERPARAWRYLLISAGSLGTGLSLAHIGLKDPSQIASAALLSFVAGVVLLLVGLLIGRDTYKGAIISPSRSQARKDVKSKDVH